MGSSNSTLELPMPKLTCHTSLFVQHIFTYFCLTHADGTTCGTSTLLNVQHVSHATTRNSKYIRPAPKPDKILNAARKLYVRKACLSAVCLSAACLKAACLIGRARKGATFVGKGIACLCVKKSQSLGTVYCTCSRGSSLTAIRKTVDKSSRLSPTASSLYDTQ